MPENTKITLSPQEQQLVHDSSWILTKRAIIEKAVRLLAAAAEKMKPVIERENSWLPEPLVQAPPKISKGENYLQLPWVMLDLPGCFAGGNIFAIRSMFWWGKFFSCTLQLGGVYKQRFEATLLQRIDVMQQRSVFYICINDDPWQHHFETGNYVKMQGKDREYIAQIIRQQHFVKIAVKFDLTLWDEIPGLLEQALAEMLELVRP